ncbi:hypothetical protein SCLCIDRAFT_21126 [Scleroderma citrinum Foug A]|uniref:DUF202 domain-containing protein n=1 Tax=Scleroderma citrinum Foug A TaxID=1036808 RepID=A0A0C3ARS0_9AGAM|nr:hypothetical protein SCLCIDRAFT_21126 [Scleroderma citrinum Foug A]
MADTSESHDGTARPALSWATFFPFTSSALASLPSAQRPVRYTRQDDIPETDQEPDGQRPTVRDYHAINSVPPQMRIPKKLATSLKVEAKVWFANERTWISWLTVAILLGTLSLALFNASKEPIARNFAYTYAAISIGVVIYGFTLYQSRISMIRKRDPGHYDDIVGPVVVSALLFFAVLANFVIRVRDLRQQKVPIPGMDFLFPNSPSTTLT